MEQKERSTLLTVLLVMLFIGGSLNLLSKIVSVFVAIGNPESPSILLSIIPLLLVAGLLVAGALMWSKNKVGLYIYYPAKVAILVLSWLWVPEVMIATLEKSEDLPFSPEAGTNAFMIIYTFLWAIFPVLFIFCFKELNQKPLNHHV